ncbi:hypothetical protein [Staphylococcus aureus]|uniref:hypothetical protein n=1 Tax=Staphylococcus aureus TaxID=1280 RepID=UPI000DE56913|nr:hypothetical protein [Staphylococcus aureus]MDN8674513.1 hypothetical protein [Staphylococcus aureus]MDN8977694.1 hypothetical protein [Staphylococcus aureus]
MTYNDELFKDIDNVAPPQKLRLNNSDKNQNSMFNHATDIDSLLSEIQSNINDMKDLYKELGSGKISENFDIRQRNEIIQQIEDYQNNVNDLTSKLNNYLELDYSNVKSLKVASTTNLDAFDKLLSNHKNKNNYTSKDLSFQRHY